MNRTNFIEIGNRQFLVDTTTGEAEEQITITVPAGTKWRTPAQQTQSKKYIEELKQSVKNNVESHKELGAFYFILTNNIFTDLSPQSAARMIMLCSYLKENKLVKRGNKPIERNDFMKILNLSKSGAYRFYNEVINKYIIKKEDGYYINADKKIFRGKIIKTSADFEQYQRIYITAVRELYKKTPISKHIQLGYIFKLLPYINLQYNIICHNPFENELNLIEPFTLDELCETIGYEKNQMARLLKEFQQLEFDYKGRNEYLISYVTNGNNQLGSHKIFINPHILYNGSNYNKVEVLATFCKDKSKKKPKTE